jgi:transposase
MARRSKYPPQLLDRGARVVIDSGRPIAHVARDLGVPAEALRRHVRRVQADEGLRPDLPTAAEREEIKALRWEVYELRRANSQGRVGVFRDRARRRPTEVSRFIDEHRGRFGVEPICRALGVSASACHARAGGEGCARAVDDERTRIGITRPDSRPAIGATKNDRSVNGRNRRPACSGGRNLALPSDVGREGLEPSSNGL